jgi:hypothetical protein
LRRPCHHGKRSFMAPHTAQSLAVIIYPPQGVSVQINLMTACRFLAKTATAANALF